jgi:hypothetical protein
MMNYQVNKKSVIVVLTMAIGSFLAAFLHTYLTQRQNQNRRKRRESENGTGQSEKANESTETKLIETNLCQMTLTGKDSSNLDCETNPDIESGANNNNKTGFYSNKSCINIQMFRLNDKKKFFFCFI